MVPTITANDLKKGKRVWIRKRLCDIVEVHPSTGLLIVRCANEGNEYPITRAELLLLQRRSEIVSDIQRQALPVAVKELMAADWRSFPQSKRDRAELKAGICKYLDKFGPWDRRTEGRVQEAIDVIMAQDTTGQKRPTVQTVRRSWDPLWIISGRNKKALLDQDHAKGNDRANDKGYSEVIEVVESLLTEHITSRVDQKKSLGRLQTQANDIVGELYGQGKISLHPLVNLQERYIGANLVRKRFQRRNGYQRLSYFKNRKEARRLMAGIGPGPITVAPLERVEGDHTKVDQLLVRHEGKDKSPIVTLLKDKYSGAITGYYLSFSNPSWFSLHEAIRMSVAPKEQFLATFKYRFVNDWPVWGVPDGIWLDREAPHRGEALAGLALTLDFAINDLPKASGYLKGAVEKSLGDYMREHIASQPGYSGPNVLARDPDKSVASATLEQAEEALVAYIVDYYNQQLEPGTGEIRIHRFTNAMRSSLNWKYPPDPTLFAGKVVSAKLTVRGVRINGLYYRSDELIQMFSDEGGETIDVVATVPKFEHDIIRVRSISGVESIEAFLDGKFSGLGLTHEEAAQQQKESKKLKATPEQRASAGRGRMHQFAGNHDLAKPPRRENFTGDIVPKKHGHNISRPPLDRDASASDEFLGHNLDEAVEYETYGARGPYATPGPAARATEQSLALAKDARDHVNMPPVGGGYLRDGPRAPSALPRSAVLASENTAPAVPATASAPNEDWSLPTSDLPPLPDEAFEI